MEINIRKEREGEKDNLIRKGEKENERKIMRERKGERGKEQEREREIDIQRERCGVGR